MAIVAATKVPTPLGERTLKVFKWTGLNAGDTAESAIVAGYSDKTVYFLKAGAFGGNMGAEGSPDPEDAAPYVTLTDPQGNAISGKTGSSVETVLEQAYQLRPTIGAGVAGVDVWLILNSVK
jgi:hypothetical protein